MSSFVKICPKCGQHNPEYENTCVVCTNFIGIETPIAASSSAGETPLTRIEALDAPSADQAQLTPLTAQRTVARPLQESLYLQVLGSEQRSLRQQRRTADHAEHSHPWRRV